jgi:sugar phosphate isomerase/epimerase
MKPCLSEAITMSATFAEDVCAFADAGCPAMEVWLTKLEEHLKRHSTAETKRLLGDRNLILAAASYQGGLLLSQGQARRDHYDQFQRRLSLCQEFDIGTLLVAPDFAEQVDAAALQRTQVSLKQACQLAATYGVRLGVEFRSSTRWLASLSTAVGLVNACQEPNLGVVFDAFHYYTGPSKLEDLALPTRENVAFVQVCDLAGVPREFAADAHRILPGDGDFQLQPIIEGFRSIGYDGWVSVELMNPELWKIKPVQVAEAAMKSLRRLLAKWQAP